MRIPALLTLVSGLALAACTVGPNYDGPAKSASDPVIRSGFTRGGATALPAAPAAGAWWTTLNDPTLTALEARALDVNPNIAVAQARLRQARAALRLERANSAPSASPNATYLHARIPGGDLASLGGGDASGGAGGGEATSGSDSTNSLDFFNLGFDASWEIDLFGGRRRSVEAARASLGAAEANVADAQVSLSADVAQAYVNLRDRQRRIVLARQSAAMQQRMLDLTQQRFDRGAASSLDVERLRGQVETTNGQVVPLAAEVESYMNALAVLTGAEPGALDAMLTPPAPVPLPPAEVAVGDPTALLQRRPDIRAAERQLAARTAQIGVADAARFPKLSFMGLIGIGGTSLSDVTDLDNLVGLATPMLQWNVLDFGRAGARVRQAEGVRDEAEANYRAAVLTALRDAEDALSRFGHRRETVASLVRTKASTDRAAALMQQRYRAGTATLIDTLDAERQRVSAEQSLSQGTAGLTEDYVALQKALGLGWAAPAH